MADKINTNVFDAEKKFVDFAGLDYFWGKAKTYIDGVDATMSAKVVTLEDKVGDSTKGLVKDVKSIQDELNSLSGGAGSIATQINNAITALDLPNTYETKGAAADALDAAKTYAEGLVMTDGVAKFDAAGAAATAKSEAIADAESKYQAKGNYEAAGTAAGLNAAMDERVKALEEIDHKQLAADASAAAVATVLDGAPESFDTLKEVAAWISNNDHAGDVATLMTDVENLKKIDHDAYVAADTKVLEDAQAAAEAYANGLAANYEVAGAAAKAETAAKSYADGLASNYDAAGSAAAAEAAAKSYADGKFQVAGNYEAEGAAAQALVDAKAYVDGKVDGKFDAAGSAAAAQAAAIAQAKADAAEALKGYYTKSEVDNLLTTNSTGDRAYAKQYTDELFGSIKFAANSDIDALFTPKA